MEGLQNNILLCQSQLCESKSATNPPYAWRIKLQAEYSLLSNSDGLAITLPNSALTEYHFYKAIPTRKD